MPRRGLVDRLARRLCVATSLSPFFKGALTPELLVYHPYKTCVGYEISGRVSES